MNDDRPTTPGFNADELIQFPALQPAQQRLATDAPPPPADGASQEDRTQYATTIAALKRQALAQAKPVEYRMYYGDFRTVNGVRWPFRLKRAMAGGTIEETHVRPGPHQRADRSEEV
jgi:hypothetical protein